MARAALGHELPGNQRLVIRDFDARCHPDTGRFVPVSVAQVESTRGEVDQGEAGVGVITMLLEHPARPKVVEAAGHSLKTAGKSLCLHSQRRVIG